MTRPWARGVRTLGGLSWPAFEVELDTESGGPHGEAAPGMVRLVICAASGGEGGVLFRLLAAGQYVIEGGFPCWPSCGARHGPLAVYRADDPVFPPPALIWRRRGG